MRGGILIDESGRFWSKGSRELMRRLDCRGTSTDLIVHALTLGCVHLQPNDSGMRVAISSRHFGRRALAAALYALAARAPRQILLAVLSRGEWSYRICASIADFGAHAEELLAGGPFVPQRYLAIEKDERALTTWPTFRRTLPLVKFWRQTRGRFSADVAPALAAMGLFDRSILARQPSGTERLITEHFGAGFDKVCSPCESFMRIGRELDDITDRPYGRWVAESYSRALAEGRLRLETCDAVVWPQNAMAIRARFDRVSLPWQDKSGERLILAVSIRRLVTHLASPTEFDAATPRNILH